MAVPRAQIPLLYWVAIGRPVTVSRYFTDQKTLPERDDVEQDNYGIRGETAYDTLHENKGGRH